jgi:tryptophan synthase beta subunit
MHFAYFHGWRVSFPALETAHAIAHVIDIAPNYQADHVILVNLSGRGDKDLSGGNLR